MYFEHVGKDSWEVKIKDLDGGEFLRIRDLSDEQRLILERGLREANVAFAHLTFWTDPKTQTSEGTATRRAIKAQARIVEEFARLSVQLSQERLKMVTVV